MSNTTTTIIKEIKDVFEHHGTVFSFEEEKNCVIGDIAQIFANKLQEVERAGRVKEQEWVEQALDGSTFFNEYENGKKIYDFIYELLTTRYKKLKNKGESE